MENNIHKHLANENRMDCPFCGSGSDMLEISAQVKPEKFFIRCKNCDATGPHTDEMLAAAVVWNFRDGFPATKQEAAA